MVIVVLAEDQNYEYYLQKLTTGSELIEHNCSDTCSWSYYLLHSFYIAHYLILKLVKAWSGTSDRGSRIIRGNTILYYDRVQSKPFLFQLIPRKIAACYSATICFICAELEGDTITVPEVLDLDILQSLNTHMQSIKEMLS